MDWERLIVDWGIKIVGAIAVLVIGSMVAKMLRRGAEKAMGARGADPTLTPFVSKFLYYLVMVFVVVAVLSFFGVQVASIVAVLGAAAFAVGLALQGTLGNFAAGIMLLIFRPFRVGEFVDIAGTAGSVHEIGVFSTQLNTPDNVRITVPNGNVWGSTIKNYAVNDNRRVDMVMGISYEDDIEQAMTIIKRVVEADERVLSDPAPVYAVAELADSSVNLFVRPWCTRQDYWALRWDLTRKMKEELEKGGCSIPFPQRDVHMHQVSA